MLVNLRGCLQNRLVLTLNRLVLTLNKLVLTLNTWALISCYFLTIAVASKTQEISFAIISAIDVRIVHVEILDPQYNKMVWMPKIYDES